MPVARLDQVHAPARVRIGHERHAVAPQPGGHGAVEGVDAELDAAQQVVDVADAEQVAGAVGLAAAPPPSTPPPRTSAPCLPERAADRDAVAARCGDSLRPTPAAGPRGRRPGRSRRRAGPRGRARACQPGSARASGGCARSSAAVYSRVDVERRALVEGQRDVRAQRRLDLHRALRAHEALAAVDVGAEAHALLVDREHRARALAGLRPAPLISSATVPWPIEKTWKPPESVMIGPSQPMKRCSRPPSSAMQLGPGLEHEVERVAEHHLVAEPRDLRGSSPRTAPLVASGTKAGVRTSPCARCSGPVRARDPGSAAVTVRADMRVAYGASMHEIGDQIPAFELPDTRGAAHAAPLDEAPPRPSWS